MRDLERILSLWRELEPAGADYVLATVVAVEGPSYRKPGALMLLTSDGRRAGTVSGGCLEAEVASRAWWLTADGPSIHRYSTADDDGERPYGSGCGGVIYLLLERRATAHPFLAALESAFAQRIPWAAATVLDGSSIGQRAFAGLSASELSSPGQHRALQSLADRALLQHESIASQIGEEKLAASAWAIYRAARPAVQIYGAGDDAKPLLALTKELGWYASILDGRSHLANRERFPHADQISVLPIQSLPDLPAGSLSPFSQLKPDDAAIVMTHSFEQDAKILACLLSLETPPGYIGVLGPRRRTRELLVEAARLLGLPAEKIEVQVDRWFARLHAPTGLDLGAESPETIALSILAEIQKHRTKATALPLRKLRAAETTVPS